MFNFLKNFIKYPSTKYAYHRDAVVIACYFNPQKSIYRKKNFDIWYDTIKHLNHRIIECVIGDSQPELSENQNISRIYTSNLLWHKETLLNEIIDNLPNDYEYVFWLDTDVIFSNKNWLVDGVTALRYATLIQPFEYCVHLDRDQVVPAFDIDNAISDYMSGHRHPMLWRSFCANCDNNPIDAQSDDYNTHGHVGFAWGARREIFNQIDLYDRALIGGADHIIAHAGVGQIGCQCISKSFTDQLDDVNKWSREFYEVIQGNVSYVSGNLYHLWHGDIQRRQYLKRVQEFTPMSKDISDRDQSGLYVTNDPSVIDYMTDYFMFREVTDVPADQPTEISDQHFGGGEFGGSGAGADWSNSETFS